MADGGLSSCMILISSLLVLQMNSQVASGKRKVTKSQNNVIDVKSECSVTSLNVTLTLDHEFQGVVYARGFPLECRSLGSREDSVNLHLTASGCGVRITPNPDGGLLYSVVIEVQMAKHLQQVTDPVVPVTCALPEEKMVLHSHAIHLEKPKSRASRMMQTVAEEERGAEQEPRPKAWLEIQGSAAPGPHDRQGFNSVSVGEPTTILVKTWLPANMSGQVVDCVAHDGLGDTSQSLIDPEGCPVDEVLVPRLHEAPALGKTLHNYHLTVLITSFPAFKFPDRDSVHIRCGLQLCRGRCQQVDCSSDPSNSKRHQRKLKDEQGAVLDYIQVFNSVEVIAPGIEIDSPRRHPRPQTSDIGTISADLLGIEFGDAPVCLSASRMAITFAALGMVFLLAVAVSLYVVLRNRLLRVHTTHIDHSRLMSRDNLSLINSRSSLSAWSYGRI